MSQKHNYIVVANQSMYIESLPHYFWASARREPELPLNFTELSRLHEFTKAQLGHSHTQCNGKTREEAQLIYLKRYQTNLFWAEKLLDLSQYSSELCASTRIDHILNYLSC